MMAANMLTRLRAAGIGLAVVAAIGIGLLLLARPVGEATELASSRMEPVPVPVQVIEVQPSAIRATLEYAGVIYASREVGLAPRMSGQITSMLVSEGESVSAGQPLATLDPGTLAAQVQQAQAGLAAANARLSSVLDGATAGDLASATQAVLTAENALASTQTALNTLLSRAGLSADAMQTQQRLDAMRGQRSAAAIEVEAALDLLAENDPFSAGTVRQAVSDLDNAITTRCGSVGNRTACMTAAQAATTLDGLVNAIDQGTQRLGVDLGSILARLDVLPANEAGDALETAAFRWIQAGASVPGLSARMNDLVFAVGAIAGAPTADDIASATRARDAAREALAAARDRVGRLDDGPTNAEVLAARATVSQAAAGVGAARAALGQTEIVAPFDGVIARRMLDVGATVSPASPVFLITAEATELRILVDEARLGQLQPGQTTEVFAPAYPDRTFAARVGAIAPTGDPRAHAFEVRLFAEDPEGLLRPGMSAHATVVTEARTTTLLVPNGAVVQTADGAAVFTVADGIARLQTVRVGIADRTSTEILDGLRAGDQVVVVGQRLVRDGEPVRVTP